MQHIAKRQLERICSLIGNLSSKEDNLMDGKLGLAFFYHYLDQVAETDKGGGKGQRIFEEVYNSIHSASPKLSGPTLGHGAAGFAYVASLLLDKGEVNPMPEEEWSLLHMYLSKATVRLIEEDNLDYFNGALGVLHYFTCRLESIPSDIDELFRRLCNKAVQEMGGSWFVNESIKLSKRQLINFGLLHGQSGILLTLLNAYHKTSHKELIAHTVLQGIRFILKHKLDVDFTREEYSFFPLSVERTAVEIQVPNKLSWCEGDLSEVLLLYRAGAIFGDVQLIQLADLIGVQSTIRRDTEETMVSNASFCQGASGLAQVYKQLYKERPLAAYHKAHEYWMEQTIILTDNALQTDLYKGQEHHLLDGLTGIGLTLLSYVADRDTNWSQMFLL